MENNHSSNNDAPNNERPARRGRNRRPHPKHNQHNQRPDTPSGSSESAEGPVKQSNKIDRWARPSLSQHGAAPLKDKANSTRPHRSYENRDNRDNNRDSRDNRGNRGESHNERSAPTSAAQPSSPAASNAQPARQTFFSSDQLFSNNRRNQPPVRRHAEPGVNPRLARSGDAPEYKRRSPHTASRPAQGPTQDRLAHSESNGQNSNGNNGNGTNGTGLKRRRFGGGRPSDNKYAMVEEIQQKALTEAPKPVVLSSGSRKLRIIPLGGAGEVGAKNMTAFEYGEDVVVIDCGIAFADKDLPGIDAVIPDVTYLEERKANLRGMVFTHGHEDHIGSVPYIWPKLNCPMYATPLTAGLINHKLDEAGLKQAKVTVINAGDNLHFGKISIEAVRLTHSIPDVLGLAIRCPAGLFFYCTDWRIEHRPVLGAPADWSRIAQLAGEGITALFSDSTNVDRPGYSPSEQIIAKAFDEIFANARGRIILAQFSSQINRIQQVLNSAKKYGRKIALSGRSMETYVNVAMNLGYLKVPEGMLIDLRKINTLPPEKVTILSTGSQGEEFSSLTRISEGEHKHVKLGPTDTVVIAASAIPGNEVAVAKMIDNLYREGANVIVNKDMDVHVSGHPSREELRFMISICKPQYFIPIHGDYRMIVEHGKLAVEQGVDANNIMIVENGQVIEFDEKGGKIAEDKVHVGDVLIDGLGVGDVGQIVIRDRIAMSKEGIVTIFMVVKQSNGEMITSPDIVSRGFIYMRESEELMQKLRTEIKESYTRAQSRLGSNWEEIKPVIRDEITDFIVKNTGRNPMVIPVIATI